MMYSGTIAAYDARLGAGFILADKGGERLPFARAELRQAGYVPQERDAYTFETRQDAAGDRHATNLRKA